MKLIVITPQTTGLYKDDTTMLCEGLEKYHGVEVIRVVEQEDGISISGNKTIEDLKSANAIYAPYEPLISSALVLKTQLGIPVIGHFEVLPEDRVFLEPVALNNINGFGGGESGYYNTYRAWAMHWNMCDVKTTTSTETLYKLERLLGSRLDNVKLKAYPLDTESLQKYEIKNPTTKNQIVSCMRLVKHKKHHHIIKALSLIKDAPKYIIIGDGPERENLEKLAKELKVDVEFKGIVSDEEKYKTIQESKFCVHLWSWLPIGEAAYYGKMSIGYYQPDTYFRLGAMVQYCALNNIEQLSMLINMYSKKQELTFPPLREFILSGRCHTLPIKEASKALLEQIKTVIK
jgi:glycosyltransferase involved in cell wall biosynthesis